jgi:hypothetical protein
MQGRFATLSMSPGTLSGITRIEFRWRDYGVECGESCFRSKSRTAVVDGWLVGQRVSGITDLHVRHTSVRHNEETVLLAPSLNFGALLLYVSDWSMASWKLRLRKVKGYRRYRCKGEPRHSRSSHFPLPAVVSVM